MAHLLMYSTNYTVCRRSAHACAHALAAPRDRKFHLLPLPCTIYVFQALAEALTTSKAMVGRRLLSCSDLSCRFCPNWIKETCNDIVNEITATWSALVDAAKAAKRKIEKEFNEFKEEAARLAREAAAAATKKFNEFKAEAERLAREAEAAATRTLNAVKAEAEKAANKATKFIDDVGGAFNELGDDIQ